MCVCVCWCIDKRGRCWVTWPGSAVVRRKRLERRGSVGAPSRRRRLGVATLRTGRLRGCQTAPVTCSVYSGSLYYTARTWRGREMRWRSLQNIRVFVDVCYWRRMLSASWRQRHLLNAYTQSTAVKFGQWTRVLTMCIIVRISPRAHSSLSVRSRFFAKDTHHSGPACPTR